MEQAVTNRESRARWGRTRRWFHGYLSGYTQALAPPEWGRDAPKRLRLAMIWAGLVISVGALASAPFLPDATRNERFFFLGAFLSIWWPWALVQWLMFKTVKRASLRQALSVTGDLAVAFAVYRLVPQSRMLVVVYVLYVVAFYAYPGGLRIGLLGTVEALSFALVTSMGVPDPHRFDPLTLVVLAVGCLAFSILLDTLTSDQRDAIDRLRELDALKDSFITTVSHELRTPLTAISGYTETLADRWDALDEEDRRAFVARVQRNSQQLSALIHQLLDLGRADPRSSGAALRPIRLGSTVRMCLDAHQEALEHHPLVILIPGDLEVVADPDGICRILGNLLTNAAKYSPPTSPIRVTATLRGTEVVVSVQDDGIGIPPDELPRVFEPFFQGTRRGPGREGTGVGLSIAARYVDFHGGRMWVDSEPGRGSVFSFTIRSAHAPSGTPVRPATARAG